jgi:hypothetical protein
VQDLSIASTSKDPSKLKLDAFVLYANQLFDFKFTATTETLASSTASIKVFVEQGKVVPILSGGLTRAVQAGSVLQLDASGSFDEDLPADMLGIDAGLLFQWSCIQISPVFSSNCSELFYAEELDYSATGVNSDYIDLQVGFILRYTIVTALQYTTIHYNTLHYTTLHYTKLH